MKNFANSITAVAGSSVLTRARGFLKVHLVLGGLLCLFPSSLLAQPKVVTDITPVNSLVSEIMKGVSEPTQILPLNASPHHFSLKPSQARAISKADLVFWIGPELTPWFDKAVDTIGDKAVVVSLLHSENTKHLMFEGHHHHGDEHHDEEGHEDEHHDDHEEDGHKEEAHHDDEDEHDKEGHKDEAHHDEEEGHDDHHDEEGHEEGEEESLDPHAWLDPQNASVWLDVIASNLSKADPANAKTYEANRLNAKAQIDQLQTELDTKLAPYADTNFAAYHDALGYFADRFNLNIVASIADGDAAKPGAKRLKEVETKLAEEKVTCLLSEPGASKSLVDAVMRTSPELKMVELHFLGLEAESDGFGYVETLNEMANQIDACLTK